MKSKQFLSYLMLVIIGLIVDYTLIHYHFNIQYSFAMLFLNAILYKVRYKQFIRNNKFFHVIYMLFTFIAMPIWFSLYI